MPVISVNTDQLTSLRSVLQQRRHDLAVMRDRVHSVRRTIHVSHDDRAVRDTTARLDSTAHLIDVAQGALDEQQRKIDSFLRAIVELDSRPTQRRSLFGLGQWTDRLRSGWNKATSVASGLLDSVEGAADRVYNRVVNGLNDLKHKTVDKVKAGFSVLKNATKSVADRAEDWGKKKFEKYVSNPLNRLVS